MSAPSYTFEAQFVSIRKIIDDVRGGHILIPRFQRPFVWSDEQRLELLRSVKASMPMGSMLVWRTSKLRLACYDQLGPHHLPAPPADELHARSYLLDGHQRLSTLFGLFAASPSAHDHEADEIDWDIRYNLRTEDFVFACRHEHEPLVRLPDLMDARSARRLQRELGEEARRRGWTDEDLERWTERLDELALRVQEYRIPIIPVVTDDLELATKTFSRINSQGTPMNEVHMVSALTWTLEFDLRDYVDETLNILPPGWQGLDDRIIFNTLKGVLGLDFTKAGADQLAKKIREDTGIVMRVAEAIDDGVRFLNDEVGVPSHEYLPYAWQLVVLATALQKTRMSAAVRGAVADWIHLTTFWETFAGAPAVVAPAAVDDVLRLLGGQRSGWPFARRTSASPLLRRFDLRSARARQAATWLAGRPGLADADGTPFDGRLTLRRDAGKALMKLVSSSQARGERLRELQQGACNVFVLPFEQQATFRERLLSGADLPDPLLEAHFLTPSLLGCLRRKEWGPFLEGRLELMRDADERRYREIHARVLGPDAPA